MNPAFASRTAEAMGNGKCSAHFYGWIHQLVNVLQIARQTHRLCLCITHWVNELENILGNRHYRRIAPIVKEGQQNPRSPKEGGGFGVSQAAWADLDQAVTITVPFMYG